MNDDIGILIALGILFIFLGGIALEQINRHAKWPPWWDWKKKKED